jgi:NAD+ kinase
MARLQKLAFVVNSGKTGAVELAEFLVKEARSHGADIVQTDSFPVPANFLEGRDACCVIGGDGTLLSVAEHSARCNVPIIGVNRGTLGFLTVFSPDEAREKFLSLLDGAFHLSHRSILQCGNGVQGGLALNDVVIKEAGSSRLIELDVFADEEWVTRFGCDGLIFSTPTGSTAYNLSAGGPVTHPHARIIAMTPICPHTLSNRSVIFDESVRLTVINAKADHPLSAVMDGQRTLRLEGGGQLAIAMSSLRVPLVQPVDYSHFSVIRTKLGWMGAASTREAPPPIPRC